MKNLYLKKRKNSITNALLKLVLLSFLVLPFSCSKDDCLYNTTTTTPVGCTLESELNLSTGIDTNGNVITPALGEIDPYWKIINSPSLISCSATTANTFTGDAYVINYNNGTIQGPDDWANQSGSSTLAPFDFGVGTVSGCSNPINGNGDSVPYVFERSFCVLENTTVDFSFTYKADNEVYFDLINNSNNLPVLPSSTTYIYSSGASTWSASAVTLPAGSYSIRGYLVNYGSVLGMSLVGNMTTTNGDLALSNNEDGCCENNVISVLNILDENCDGDFDNGVDLFGVGYTFNLLDSNNTIIRTEITDANGNVFFAGLPDGTYTTQIVSQAGWVPSNPASGQTTITVTGNTSTIQEFYNCIN